MQSFRIRFSALYNAFVETPELAKFRRYLEIWSWSLNNQIAVIEKRFQECNDVIASIEGVPRETSVYRVTDYHCAYEVEEHPVLKVQIQNLRELVRNYSKDLVLAYNVANLPEQDQVFARHFAKYQRLFDNGVYGPTKEDARMYQAVPSHVDLCSFKGREEEDTVTNFLLKHIEFINGRLNGAVRWVLRNCLRRKESPQHEDALLPEYISLNTVRTTMHYLAGVFVPLLLAGTLGALSSLESEKERIVVLGCFGFVMTWSLILLIPGLKRSDLFAIAAAYFSVGGIYIGARGIGAC